MLTPGTALWIVGVGLVIGGLVSVLRYRIALGAGLMVAGLTLGLVGTVTLD
ncbi:hypothetical protein OG394_20015 [Kribbella sp. NBC_01245]|uniref:hypothetical protein n=1 Tax=Kribbella sp. NBC_01245 TaxID=2903578 RepID=UPI002E29E02E|nr:hypothetical protein [Kribbella sp. NBC_01245]